MFRIIGNGEENIRKHSSIRHFEQEKNVLHLLGFEPQVIQPTAKSRD
jgi:hypothetical protein